MRKNLILLILVILFVLPGASAWLLYSHPQWLKAASTNKGTLLKPSPRVNELGNRAKWRLIFWQNGDCKKKCLAQLDRLARIRLALGRRLYEVDEVLLQPVQSHTNDVEVDKLLQEHDIRVMHLPMARQDPVLADKAQFFIASPDNYLVLKYPVQVKSEAIYQDIKKLLNNPGSR